MSLNEKARNLAFKMEVGYCEISTKYSPKEHIEELFISMINENELYSFHEQERKEGSGWRVFRLRLPCSDGEGCSIY